MSFEVVSKAEHEALQAQVDHLARQLMAHQQQIDALLQGAKKWYSVPAASRFFIGPHGKPVYRLTMDRMVKRWIAGGDLVEGVNYRRCDNTRYISEDFLKPQAAQYRPNKKLKAA